MADFISSRAVAEQLEREALYIHPSKNSSLTLATSPLDGTNFLPWSRSIYVTLGTKMKLGFIDGTFPRPEAGSVNFEQWRRVDLMVTSWIWNSISKEIVESFMYVNSSRDLWLEIQSRYRRSNGPMIYRIQREISSISQHDLSLTAYVTKLKKYWNKLSTLAPNPRCTCGCCICGEPLPDLDRAFSMLFTVEKQRQQLASCPLPIATPYTDSPSSAQQDTYTLHPSPESTPSVPEHVLTPAQPLRLSTRASHPLLG
ncbi:UNVERIFIED_CONTAM: hypothetical protein Sindi_1253500 [Sesamum indicum]